MAVFLIFFLILFLALMLVYQSQRLQEEEIKNELTREYLESVGTLCSGLQEKSEVVRRYRHDISRHIRTLEAMLERQEAVRQPDKPDKILPVQNEKCDIFLSAWDEDSEAYLSARNEESDACLSARNKKPDTYLSARNEESEAYLSARNEEADAFSSVRNENSDTVVFTRNEVLDAILYTQKKRCDRLQIPFVVHIMETPVSFYPAADHTIHEKDSQEGNLANREEPVGVFWLEAMQDTDCAALFLNLLDNAVEAQERICEGERKEIRLSIGMTEEKNEVWIELQNQIPSGEQIDFQTRKEVPSEHGIGMKVIWSVIQKYDGHMESTVDEKRHSIKMRLFFPRLIQDTSRSDIK